MTGRGQLAGRARSTLRAWRWQAMREPVLCATVALALLVYVLAVLLMMGPGW